MTARLSIILPVYEEADRLPPFLERLLVAPCPIPREWVFVDDASSDGSATMLQRFVEEHRGLEAGMVLIRRTENGGKGCAVRDGIEVAGGDYIIVQDADDEYDPGDIPRLLEPLLEDRADVVYGSRFRRERHQVHRTFHFLVNRLLTALSNLLSGIYLSDMETCYKLFRADLLKAMQLRSNRFGFEVEATAYVAKTGARIFEIPITYYPRNRLSGKKIGWRDGVAALWHLVNYNLLVSEARAFTDLPARYRR